MTAIRTHTRPTAGRRAEPRPWPIVVLELLTALSAAAGGVGLLWDDAIRMPDDWLTGTPFHSWVLPGIFLILVVAVPMATAAALELRRSPMAGVASVGAGAAQIGWIGAELLIMGRYNVLQPVMMLVGLAVLLLSVWVRRHRPLLPATSFGGPLW